MASPIETATWDRKKPCGCKGCSVSVKYDRDRIMFMLNKLNLNEDLLNQIRGIVEESNV